MLTTTAPVPERRSADATDASTATRAPRILLYVALIELVLLYWPTVNWLFGRWTLSVWSNAHGILIPPLVAYFVYDELRRHAGLPRRSSAWGFAIVVPALALCAIDAGMHTELLSAISLVLLLPGLSLLLLGVPRTRAILWPLSLLAFALPLPLAFTNPVVWQLRKVVTAGTSTIVPWLGIPVFVEGTTLHMPSGSLIVADACSGFSTLYAALAVACLVAYSVPSTGRRILVLTAAAPIAVVTNVARVALLVALVEWRGEGILDTFVHPLSGMLTFALALPVIFWLGDHSREGRTA
jgi:exosortase